MTQVKCAFLAVALLVYAHTATAQQTVNVGSISGRVTDASGAVVPGSTVTARQTDTNQTAATETDRQGRFRFPYLRIGPYEITVALAGFADARRELMLTAGSAFELPVVLTVGGLDTSVTVTGGGAVLEAARSQIAGTVSEPEIRALPLNGRNVLDLALLVPGVAPANIPSTQLFPETSAVPGISLSVAGQRNLSNNVIVDGLSANDDAAALSGITYSVDAIEQFQVVTSGGQAELGRALGGYVNVVTRSGTNVVHGGLYEYFRDDRLTAKSPLSGDRLPMRQSQFGGSLGGPIVPNRTFFFTNVEQRRLDQTGLTTIAPDNVLAINAHLSAVGYRGPLLTTGRFASPVDSTNVLFKIDHAPSARDQFSARFSLYDVTSENARGAGGLSSPTASSALDNLDRAVAFGNTLSLSGTTVLETRAQIARGDLKAPPTDEIGPAVSIAGVGAFGRLSSSPTARLNTMYQIVNNLSHQAGAHAIRVGADVLYNSNRIEFPRAVGGTYSFSSLANFLAGTYNNAGFSQTFGDTEVAQTNPNLGVYLQDEWKLRPDVTLNLGVRYDLQSLETIHTDTDNVSPRLGVAWSPFASRRTIIRGGAGLYYDRVPLRALANALLSANNTTNLGHLRQVSISLSPTQAGAPTFPKVLAEATASVTLPSLSTMDRHIQNASSRQASLEVEEQLGDRATASVSYQYLRGSHLLMSINQNVPTCVASGANNGCRPNPEYANNNQYSSVGESSYHGLQISFVQRPSALGQYRVSYTLSRARNNLGEFFFSSPIDPTDLSKDWGRSDNDQRHRLVVDGELHASAEDPTTMWGRFTRGFSVSGMLQVYSAPPFNITSGATTIQGTSARPLVNGTYIERNAGVGTAFVNLSARVSRTFHLTGRVELEAVLEGFNLTNHQNVVTRNTNFGAGAYPTSPSASFGQVTAVGEPRAGQLAMRLRF